MIQLSPPLIAGPEQFAEIEEILRGVLTEAGERMQRALWDAGRLLRPRQAPLRVARMLTVGDLLRDLDVRLLAGERGLHLPVRWVHISELLDPTPWLSGGELLLTTGMQLDTPAQEREFARAAGRPPPRRARVRDGLQARRGPEPLLEVAAEREFPVFEVPYEVPFIAVTEAAFTQLVNEQYAVLRRALAAQERLERIVLSERGLDALVGALATLIGAAVVVFDARGEPLQQHAFRRAIEPDALETLRDEVRERARRREARAFMPSLVDGNQGLALPVAADGAPAEPRVGAGRPVGRPRRGWWRSRTPARCRTSTG